MTEMIRKGCLWAALLALPFITVGCQHSGLRLTSAKVDQVLGQMTREEKIRLVVGAGNEKFLGYGSTKRLVPGAAGTTAPLPRLGIPPTVLSDGPAGIRIDTLREGDPKRYYHTGFPIGTALAASWNTTLMEEVGRTIGKEARAYGLDLLFAPGMNLQRDPLGGRNFEYYSEDPMLSGRMGAAFVRGVQLNGVGACPKHYVVNNQETNRKDVDNRVAPRPLHELYLRGFEIALRESHPWAVMSAYNAVNGEQCMESRRLLTDVLRDELHFDGIVVSDWAAPGWRDAAREIHAGNDLLAPGSDEQCRELRNAIAKRTLQEADLDTCAKRMLRFVARTPRGRGYKASNKVNLEADAAVSRQAADEAVVLLENHVALPFQSAVHRIGLFGITSYNFISVGTGSGNVKSRHTVNLLEGLSHAGLSVSSEAARYYRAVVADTLAVRGYNELGYAAIPEPRIDSALIMRSALTDDAAVVTIGRSSGEGADRNVYTDFLLQPNERRLLHEVAAAFHQRGKKVVVILNVPGVVETASWRNDADALLCAWLPGQQGGDAVADILTGRVSPSGRLPLTWCLQYADCNTHDNFPYDYHGPKAIGNYTKIPRQPAIKNVHYVNYEEGIYVGYRYFDTFDKPVAYPFGYGLSYTRFVYSDPKLIRKDDTFEVELTVTNCGKAEGKEVVQLYAPLKGLRHQLVAFAKTRRLAPGKSQRLKLNFTSRELSYYDEATASWKVDRDIHNVELAADSRDIRLTLPLP